MRKKAYQNMGGAFLQLIRFNNLMMIALVQMLLYFWLMRHLTQEAGVTLALRVKHFYMLMYSTLLIAAFGNIINDLYDIETDRINKQDKPLAANKISIGAAMAWAAIMLFAGLGIALRLCLQTQLFSYFYLFVAIGALLWIYAAILKGSPLIGNLLISALTAFSIGIIGLFDYSLQPHTQQLALQGMWMAIGAYVVFAFLCNLMRELIKDMEDIEGDAASALHTLPVMVGVGVSKIVLWIISLFTTLLLAVSSYLLLASQKKLAIYLAIAVFVPLLVFLLRLYKSKDYGYLSGFVKFIMFTGILSMLFI